PAQHLPLSANQHNLSAVRPGGRLLPHSLGNSALSLGRWGSNFSRHKFPLTFQYTGSIPAAFPCALLAMQIKRLLEDSSSPSTKWNRQSGQRAQWLGGPLMAFRGKRHESPRMLPEGGIS